MPAKLSKRALAEKKRKEQEDKAFAEKLKRQIAQMGRGSSGKTINAIPALAYRESSHKKYGSADLTPFVIPDKVELTPEMAEREKEAQHKIKILKGRVGILYNKGGYQFISEGTDLTTLGR